MIAERLKQIRILKHYTVDAVANGIGVTKQAVSKYETGKAIPSSDVMAKIISFYELPAGYLQKPVIEAKECSALFYRKGKRTPQRELEDAQIRLEWCYEVLLACSEVAKITSVDMPYFDETWSIEKKADSLRTHWRLRHEPIIDLEEVLAEHGISIFAAELENVKIDGYSQIINGRPIIVLNQNRGTLERKAFSLCHELGHLLLHAGQVLGDPIQIEKEANAFAASFLMPAEAFKRDVIRVNSESLRKLGEKWHVSPQAALERCLGLGLLEPEAEIQQAHRQYLLQKLNKLADYRIPEKVTFCSIGKLLEEIDADPSKRECFLRSVCFPIPMMQQLFQMPHLFAQWKETPDSAESIDGVQLTFAF